MVPKSCAQGLVLQRVFLFMAYKAPSLVHDQRSEPSIGCPTIAPSAQDAKQNTWWNSPLEVIKIPNGLSATLAQLMLRKPPRQFALQESLQAACGTGFEQKVIYPFLNRLVTLHFVTPPTVRVIHEFRHLKFCECFRHHNRTRIPPLFKRMNDVGSWEQQCLSNVLRVPTVSSALTNVLIIDASPTIFRQAKSKGTQCTGCDEKSYTLPITQDHQ